MNLQKNIKRIDELSNSIVELETLVTADTVLLESLKKGSIPDYRVVEQRSNTQKDLVEQEIASELSSLRSAINLKKVQARGVRNREPVIDRDKFIDAVAVELTTIKEVEDLFSQTAFAFDELFGVNARHALEAKMVDKVENNPDAYEELTRLSSRLGQIKKRLSAMNKDMHVDVFTRIMHFVFPNFGRIFHNTDKLIILVLYVVHALATLLAILYYPFVTMLLTMVLFTSMLGTFQKYNKIITTFQEAVYIRALATNADNIVQDSMGELYDMEYKDEKAKFSIEADEMEEGIATMVSDLEDKRDNSKLIAKERIAVIEAELLKEREVIDSACADKKAEQEALMREMGIHSSKLNGLRSEFKIVREEIAAYPGIGSPLELKDRLELLDPRIYYGVTDKLHYFDLVDRLRISTGSAEQDLEIVKLLITQLFSRMVPSKLNIVYYDDFRGGMDLVGFLSDEYRDLGLIRLDSEKAFGDWFKGFEVEMSNFIYSLTSFGSITKYNEFMFETNSVTQRYTVILFNGRMPSINLEKYTAQLGVYLVFIGTTSDEDELSKIEAVFN